MTTMPASALRTDRGFHVDSGVRTTRVLIVDDHPVVREGLALWISAQPDFTVCGEASDAASALRQIEITSPDVVTIDISMNGTSGIELIKQIRSRHPHVKILVASMHDEALYAERALRSGATGYINKNEDAPTFLQALRRVALGKVYVSESLSERLLCRAVGSEDALQEPPVASLSDRELEVFELIGQGVGTRAIAGRLHLSPKTVETYRENIKVKLNLHNGTELMRYAVAWSLENR